MRQYIFEKHYPSLSYIANNWPRTKHLLKKFVLSNPNKYFFPISSAPKSVKNGKPSFIGTALDLGLTDVSDAISKRGKTFNKETNKGKTVNGTGDITRFHTSNYSQLIREKRYEKRLV